MSRSGHLTRGDVPIERRRVEIGGVPIVYQQAGDGPPLVLIHGLSASSRWWAKNVGAFAERHRVQTVDLIGFGESRGSRRFALGEAAGYLAAWMERTGVERADVVGHSMGGHIAAELAADFPERVGRLVLASAAAMPFGDGYARHVAGLVRSVRRGGRGHVPVLVADAWRAGPRTIVTAARELVAADISPKLERIEAPTLLVWGERDPLVPLEYAHQLLGRLRHADLVVIPAASHNVMLDRPDAFNRVVLEFLGEG